MADAYYSALDTCPYLLPDAFFLPDAFADQAVTKALQLSISSSSSSASSAASLPPPPPPPLLQPAATELHSLPAKRDSHCQPSGRVAKRKSRASKRSATTFIAADPANFRQMVQQVTGAHLAGLPDLPAEPAPLREPRHGCGVPTLDTSALFLDNGLSGPVRPAGSVQMPGGFEFEPFPCFPTLESWTVM